MSLKTGQSGNSDTSTIEPIVAENLPTVKLTINGAACRLPSVLPLQIQKKNVRIGNDADFVVVTCIFSGEEDVRKILLCSFRRYFSRILAEEHAGMV